MTVATREKLMQFCIDNSVSQGAYESLREIVDTELSGMDKANSQMNREKFDLQRKYDKLEALFKDVHLRFNCKIMSVYYLLDTVSKTGTHREKETVIMYMKLVLENMIHKGDPLPIDEENLPF